MEETIVNKSEPLHFDSRLLGVIFTAVTLAVAGYFLATYNFLLFHSLVEIFSIVVAFGIFVIAWNSRSYLENDYLLFLGIAYLFIGGIDLVHTLAYEGMGVFSAWGSNLPTQLWIMGRYMEGLTLFVAPVFLTRKLDWEKTILGYLIVTAFLFGAVFYWGIFPDCFVPGSGLTSFKVVSEYVISGLLIGAILGLIYYRKKFDRKIFWLLISAIGLTVLSELAFTFYVSVYGFSNLVGHLFKLVSFYLIYQALIETGLREPHRLIFREQQRYKELVENMSSGVAVFNAIENGEQFVFKEFNSAAERIDGLDREEVIGKKVSEVFPGVKDFGLFEVFQQVWKTGKPQHHPVSTYEDERITGWRDNYVFKLPSGEVVSVYDDVTEQKRTEKELEEQRANLRNLHEAVDQFQQCEEEEELCNVAVQVTERVLDFDLCTFYCVKGDQLTPVAASGSTDVTELSEQKLGEGLVGKAFQEKRSILSDDLQEEAKDSVHGLELRGFMSIPIGEVGAFQVASNEEGAFDEDDLELGEILAGHLREEIKRIRVEEELRRQAILDPLTDLYNRRYFNETLQKEVQQAKRYDKPLAFLMADINRFKEVNDRYSHRTGDQVLKIVADLFRGNFRDADTVVRYGGDEFLVMMPETNGGATNTVERLNEELDRWNEQSDLLDFPLTLAIGISHWSPDQDRGVEEALKEADEKMYEDKKR